MSHALPILRAGFEGSGSPRWLMRTMQTNGFDRAHGFQLDLVLQAEGGHRHGTLQALADGDVDLVDADRLALATAQGAGLPVTAVHPYGRIFGSLVVHRDFRGDRGPAANELATLRGCRLGVLAMHDKNWTLLAAACTELAAFELVAAVRPVLYGCRADLVAALAAGEVDAALVHWHLVPRLTAAGHRVLAELPEIADALAGANGAAGGASAALPTTFFVMHQTLAATRPALVSAFIAATTDTVARLRDDDHAWQTLAREGAIGEPDRLHLAALRARWFERIGRYITPISQRSIPCHPF